MVLADSLHKALCPAFDSTHGPSIMASPATLPATSLLLRVFGVQHLTVHYCRHGPGEDSERYSYDSIRNSQVRALVQPGDEKLMVFPHPSMATDSQPAVVGKEPQGKPCSNCQHLLVARLACGSCRSVWVSSDRLALQCSLPASVLYYS